jgi:hypothetical protein
MIAGGWIGRSSERQRHREVEIHREKMERQRQRCSKGRRGAATKTDERTLEQLRNILVRHTER